MVSLRAVSVDDPEARELLTDYFAMRAAVFPGQAYRTVFPDATVFTPPDGVFVILDDDSGGRRVPVGCAGIRRVPDGTAGARYELKHLFVEADGRGRGWGRILLEDLERRARDLGAVELVLDTHHTLEAAGSLYARSGFVPIEPYNDNPNATRWYGKVLAVDTPESPGAAESRGTRGG